MYVQVEKPNENKSRVIANSIAQKKKSGMTRGFGFVDNRPDSIVQRKLQESINNRSLNASIANDWVMQGKEEKKHGICHGFTHPNSTMQRLRMQENPDKKKDAETFFKHRNSQNDATSCAHNYAFMNSETEKWAKSSGSGHAETQLTGLYAQDGDDMYIVSELQPCDACQTYLPKVEAARGIEITVYHNLPHKDTGDGNRAAILEMYQNYHWLSKDYRFTTYILRAGESILTK